MFRLLSASKFSSINHCFWLKMFDTVRMNHAFTRSVLLMGRDDYTSRLRCALTARWFASSPRET